MNAPLKSVFWKSASLAVYATRPAFPDNGLANTLYIAEDTDTMYYWDGAAYVSLGGGAGSEIELPILCYQDFTNVTGTSLTITEDQNTSDSPVPISDATKILSDSVTVVLSDNENAYPKTSAMLFASTIEGTNTQDAVTLDGIPRAADKDKIRVWYARYCRLDSMPAGRRIPNANIRLKAKELDAAGFVTDDEVSVSNANNTIVKRGAAGQIAVGAITAVSLMLTGLTASRAVITDASSNLTTIEYSSNNVASSLVSRDSNGDFSARNISANALSSAVVAITMNNGSTTLTASSAQTYILTGTLDYTFNLPDATTLEVNHVFEFKKISSGVNNQMVIRNNGGSNLVQAFEQTRFCTFILRDNSTANGTWTVINGSSESVAFSYVMRTSAGVSTMSGINSGYFASITGGGLPSTGVIRLAAIDTINFRNGAGSGNVTISRATGDIINFSNRISAGTVSGTTGTLGLIGSTSGTVTIQPQAAAGTYNFNLPTTAGSSGNFLTSAGGGSSAMTWTTIIPVSAGGTGVDLSATGGASQVLRQSTVGGNITVSQLAQADISGLTTASTPQFTGGLYGTGSSQNYYLSNSTTVQVSENRSGSNIFAGYSSFSFDNTNANNGSFLALNRSRSATIGSHSAVSNNDRLGLIHFGGSDGSTFIRGAAIIGLADNTVSSDTVPTRLEFQTMDSGGTLNKHIILDSKKNKVFGTADLATTATDGFIYVPKGSGAPTGTPTSYSGVAAQYLDELNERICYRVNGAWKYAQLI